MNDKQVRNETHGRSRIDSHKRSLSSDPRFNQLLHKARAGDACSIHDLWTEFHFDFERNGGSLE